MTTRTRARQRPAGRATDAQPANSPTDPVSPAHGPHSGTASVTCAKHPDTARARDQVSDWCPVCWDDPALTRMIGYLRVSTREQARTGYGLAAQRTALTTAGEAHRWALRFISDESTGANMNRPGITAALGLLADGTASGLAVAKLDRVSRSVVDFGTLLETSRREQWTFAALDLGVDTSTPAGELVANVMIAIGQWERRVIGQRTRDGLAQAKAEGKRLGRPRRIDPALLARVVELHEDGVSNRDIAKTLNAEGVPTVNGGARWHHGTIGGLIASARLDVETDSRLSASKEV